MPSALTLTLPLLAAGVPEMLRLSPSASLSLASTSRLSSGVSSLVVKLSGVVTGASLRPVTVTVTVAVLSLPVVGVPIEANSLPKLVHLPILVHSLEPWNRNTVVFIDFLNLSGVQLVPGLNSFLGVRVGGVDVGRLL